MEEKIIEIKIWKLKFCFARIFLFIYILLILSISNFIYKNIKLDNYYLKL